MMIVNNINNNNIG